MKYLSVAPISLLLVCILSACNSSSITSQEEISLQEQSSLIEYRTCLAKSKKTWGMENSISHNCAKLRPRGLEAEVAQIEYEECLTLNQPTWGIDIAKDKCFTYRP